MFFMKILTKLKKDPKIKPTINKPNDKTERGALRESKKIKSTGTCWLLFTANKTQ